MKFVPQQSPSQSLSTPSITPAPYPPPVTQPSAPSFSSSSSSSNNMQQQSPTFLTAHQLDEFHREIELGGGSSSSELDEEGTNSSVSVRSASIESIESINDENQHTQNSSHHYHSPARPLSPLMIRHSPPSMTLHQPKPMVQVLSSNIPRPFTLQTSNEHLEFNDGTLSPLPTDPDAYWNDAYQAAWNCMSEKEEEDYFDCAEYKYFEKKLHEGKLVVSESDLPSIKYWQVLGFFLSKNNDVQSLRFHGVDLRVSDFLTFKQVLLKCSLANHAPSSRKRSQKEIRTGVGPSCRSTDLSSSSSSFATQPSSAAPSPDPLGPTSLAREWTGGWGVDIDQLDTGRRRRELRLRHVTFIDNNLGTNMHYSKEEIKQQQSHASHTHGHHHRPKPQPQASGLENVISMLLFCELLETCNIWRNNLDDKSAVELCQELLLKHPSLQKLSLRWNGVTVEGAKELEQILKQMTSNIQESKDEKDDKPVGGGRFQELDLSSDNIQRQSMLRQHPFNARLTPFNLLFSFWSCLAISSFNRIDPAHHQTLFADAYQIPPPADIPNTTILTETISDTQLKSSPPITTPINPSNSTPLIHTSFETTHPLPKSPIRVNLRSQHPHSPALLSHFLRLTAVHQNGSFPLSCARAHTNATNLYVMQQHHGLSQAFTSLRTVISSA